MQEYIEMKLLMCHIFQTKSCKNFYILIPYVSFFFLLKKYLV